MVIVDGRSLWIDAQASVSDLSVFSGAISRGGLHVVPRVAIYLRCKAVRAVPSWLRLCFAVGCRHIDLQFVVRICVLVLCVSPQRTRHCAQDWLNSRTAIQRPLLSPLGTCLYSFQFAV